MIKEIAIGLWWIALGLGGLFTCITLVCTIILAGVKFNDGLRKESKEEDVSHK